MPSPSFVRTRKGQPRQLTRPRSSMRAGQGQEAHSKTTVNVYYTTHNCPSLVHVLAHTHVCLSTAPLGCIVAAASFSAVYSMALCMHGYALLCMLSHAHTPCRHVGTHHAVACKCCRRNDGLPTNAPPSTMIQDKDDDDDDDDEDGPVRWETPISNVRWAAKCRAC
jgi:hypothetical protein